MNLQRCLLGTYRLLLQFYPAAFRHRFAPEMLELAAVSEPAEWPLILGDTSVAIVRCWIEGSPSTAAVAEPNAYVPLGGSPVKVAGVLQGFVLSIVIIAGLFYAGDRWSPTCLSSGHVLTTIVEAPSAAVSAHETSHPSRRRTPQQSALR